LSVLGLTFLFFWAGALSPVNSQAHLPNKGIAAGVFSSKTSDMCPGGSNGDRCDSYGLAYCFDIGWAHQVGCRRYSTDYRTFLKIPYRCRVDGHVRHDYVVTWKKYFGCWQA